MEVKPGYKQTEVGVIPEDWHAQRIDSVCKLINGRGFKPHEWQTSGLPIIRIQNLNGSDDFNYFKGEYDRKLEVDAGQLLFAWSGSRGTSFGPHIWQGPLGLLNYHTWKVAIQEIEVRKDFFLHALKKLTTFIEDKAHGASALVHTQKWEMESFQFPLPPTKTEQDAIAGALGDADALIESLEQLVAKKRLIKHGAMQELLTGQKRLPWFAKSSGHKQTDVGLIPEDWEVRKVRELVRSGPKNGYSGRSGIGVAGTPTLSLSATTSGDFVLTQETVKYLEMKISPESDLYLKPDDVLVQRSNTIELVGTTAIFTGPANTYVYPDLMMRLRFQDGVVAQWYWRYANSSVGRSYFMSVAAGSTGRMPKLSGDKVREMPIPLPPTKGEQEAITGVLSDIDAEIAAVKAKLARARLVKAGMMQELLTGKTRLVKPGGTDA